MRVQKLGEGGVGVGVGVRRGCCCRVIREQVVVLSGGFREMSPMFCFVLIPAA